MRHPILPAVAFSAALLLICATPALTQSSTASAPIPGEISADLGACSAVITVTGSDSKPVYAAKVTARIQYGMFGIKRLDLEAYTGSDGRLTMKGMPGSLKKPVFIHIAKDGKEDSVEFEPDIRCHATFDVQLH